MTHHTTDTQRGADGAGRVYSLMVCRVCGTDSLDEVCPECRQPFSSPYGNGCAICEGFGGMTANGTWTICPNCSKWDMGGQHYRNINNRSVIMVDPEKFVAGVRRIRDLTEQRDALVAALEERDNTAADLILKNRALIAALSALLGVPERNVEAMLQRGEENAKQFLKTLRGAGEDEGDQGMVTDIWADVRDDEAGQRITVFAVGEPGCYVANGHIAFEPFITAVVESGFCVSAEEEWGDPRHTWMITEQGEGEWELFYHEVREGTRDAYPVTLIPVKGYWKEQPS